MDSELKRIEEKIKAGERLDFNDALALFNTRDLFELGRIANSVKERLHGDKVCFGVSLNINHTNICTLRCPICAFSTDSDDKNAYFLSQREIIDRVQKAAPHNISEVHIVGGLHDTISRDYFKEMFSNIKREDSSLNINALTATECAYISTKEKIPLHQLFLEFKTAGLGSMPGGGAEILNDEIRKKIAPLKISSGRWLEVSEAAHRAGIRTNATMLWGHIESYSDRVEHMFRLRELQDKTHGFKSFVPLLFHPQNTKFSHLEKVSSAAEILKVYAASRLILDNFDHIKALWMYLGIKFSPITLRFGADDMGATSFDEQIVHAAGSQSSISSKDKLIHQIHSMQLVPCEVDSNYRLITTHRRDRR
jgi:aminodeoxyfutalosine synthase